MSRIDASSDSPISESPPLERRLPVRVPEERVLRDWLAREIERNAGAVDSGTVPTNATALLDALLSAKPGAAAFLWREQPIRWYRLVLDRDRFVALRPVDGPDDLLWRDVSTDGTLFGVAERVHTEGIDPLDAAGIDAEAIRTYRDELAAGTRFDPLIVRTRRGATPWFVADGNHRATAAALHALETGRYDPMPAYVAVTANPVLEPIVDRARGLLQRLAGRSIGRCGRRGP
ncbi:hypothetical protein [Natrinema pallidum]|uniref:ParB/Sulfiredoxin domain-containing protein n=1 Tax=Natrinema pallidum TaxID=69527 RepID=A0A4P9TBC8_9EURY|nr:hypothetical protein [Natrinema pallidum]QCW01921.1 hypothetical protein FGF80_01100 [Natrinema pallidum]